MYQDRSAHDLSLSLLCSLAAAPDPCAFILLERHIHLVLLQVLETSSKSSAKVEELSKLLNHVRIRHEISASRHTLLELLAKANLDDGDIASTREVCERLVNLSEEDHAEIWVKLLVQDLLLMVAQSSVLAPILLEGGISSRIRKLAHARLGGLSTGRLERKLAKLQPGSRIESERQDILGLLSKETLSTEESERMRMMVAILLDALKEKNEKKSKFAAETLLVIAKSPNVASLVLTDGDTYGTLHTLWAGGSNLVDDLLPLIDSQLRRRVKLAAELIDFMSTMESMSKKEASKLAAVFQDLITIWKFQ